jgi:rod shape-determining protein MreD
MLLYPLRIFFPYMLAVLFLFLATVPLGEVGLNICRPMVLVMLFSYFALYRPYFYPYWFLFIIGMLYDAALGLPLGMNALTYILVKAVIVWRRDKYLRAPFGAIWIQFAVLMVGTCLIQWMIMSFIYNHFFNFSLIMLQLILSIALYPFFHRLFMIVSRMTPRGVNEEKLIGNYYK